ncbi:MAG: putative GCN5-related N-acetyltransferase [candidate division NC10 bacterium]|nr:putative GCN5-related N-acetyltransferase [candidate division NC10 bacterium]MBM2836562.1 putative GCN5-related N-acetyltransferase [candidate division NC10 bacterium]
MLTVYPKKVRLQSGTSVTIRPMVKEDADKLYAFFSRVPREDRLFLRDDVSIRDVIDSWTQELDYRKVLPLVAEVGGNIVGDATLHRRTFGWTSHVGKVRLVIDKDYRGKGLGTVLIEELIDIAKKAGLEQLVAELISDQTGALSAFKRLGFEKEAVFFNYVKDQMGEERNLVVMIKNLRIEPAMVLF